MSNLLKKLLAILALVVLIFIGYMLFGRGETNNSLLVTTDVANIDSIELETARIINQTQEIDQYDVSGTLFASPLFTSLVDFRTSLGEEPTGRVNPFAPVR